MSSVYGYSASVLLVSLPRTLRSFMTSLEDFPRVCSGYFHFVFFAKLSHLKPRAKHLASQRAEGPYVGSIQVNEGECDVDRSVSGNDHVMASVGHHGAIAGV